MLLDNNIYMKVKKDPTKHIIGNLRKITTWKNFEYISNITHKALINSDGLLSRAYGLLKVYKVNCPFRIIVSFVDSPLCALATFLQKTFTISTSISLFQSHIENFKLVEKLTNTHIEDEFSFISLNVVPLFTNNPIDLAIATRYSLGSPNLEETRPIYP